MNQHNVNAMKLRIAITLGVVLAYWFLISSLSAFDAVIREHANAALLNDTIGAWVAFRAVSSDAPSVVLRLGFLAVLAVVWLPAARAFFQTNQPNG